MAAQEDPLVAPVSGSFWALVSPFDAWREIRGQLKEADLKRLEAAVRAVLFEVDPASDLPAEERWRAGAEGKVRKYSSDLRTGLARSLALLGVNGDAIDDGKGAAYATYLVRTLLAEANKDETCRLSTEASVRSGLRRWPCVHEALSEQLEWPSIEPSIAVVVDPVQPGLARGDSIARGSKSDPSAWLG